VVAQTYRANDQLSPIHDPNGILSLILQQVLKGYANTDPSEKPQKAISPQVIHGMLHSMTTPEDITFGQLVKGAFLICDAMV
jgi:hypothetical protein